MLKLTFRKSPSEKRSDHLLNDIQDLLMSREKKDYNLKMKMAENAHIELENNQIMSHSSKNYSNGLLTFFS